MRLLSLLALLFSVRVFAFSTISVALTPATPLVWYEAHGPSGAVVEGQDFVPRFIPWGNFGLDAGGRFFGTDSYQFDTITCGWGTAGVASGGTDVMRVQLIQKSDAGVVCTCDLPGACNDAAGSEHTCSCSGGVKHLGVTPVEPGRIIGPGFAIQWNSSTNCGTNPSFVTCAIPFRK
jgi:hypothetical protein